MSIGEGMDSWQSFPQCWQKRICFNTSLWACIKLNFVNPNIVVIRIWWLGSRPECGISALSQSEPSTLAGLCQGPAQAAINSCALTASRLMWHFPSCHHQSYWLFQTFLLPYPLIVHGDVPDRKTTPWEGRPTASASRSAKECVSVSRGSSCLFFRGPDSICAAVPDSERSASAAFLSFLSSCISLFIGSSWF